MPAVTKAVGPWKLQQKRAEMGSRVLSHLFKLSADCCEDQEEGEERTADTSESAPLKGYPEPGAKTGLGIDGPDRRAMVDAYIQEVLATKGKRIIRTDIWRKAGYTTRTEFERWERNDPRNPNKAAHQNFTRILTEKPHLK